MSKISAVTFDVKPEDLKEKVIEKAAELVSDWIREEAHEYTESEIKRAMKKAVDDEIKTVIDTEVQPLVKGHLDKIIMKETNSYGEAKGHELTFKEFLVKKAEDYLREEVSWDGKTRNEDSYSWKGSSTRIAYMVDKHLYFTIEKAMKEAVQNANTHIFGGIAEAVKLKLAEVSNSLQIGVKTK
jgi:hypothetical protein